MSFSCTTSLYQAAHSQQGTELQSAKEGQKKGAETHQEVGRQLAQLSAELQASKVQTEHEKYDRLTEEKRKYRCPSRAIKQASKVRTVCCPVTV